MPRHPGPEPGSCVLGLCYNGCGRKVVREPGNCFVRHVKESFTAPTRGGTISSHGWFLSMPPNLPLEGRSERQAFAKAQAIRVGVAVPDFKSMGMGDSLPPPGSAMLLRPPLKGEVGRCFLLPSETKNAGVSPGVLVIMPASYGRNLTRSQRPFPRRGRPSCVQPRGRRVPGPGRH